MTSTQCGHTANARACCKAGCVCRCSSWSHGYFVAAREPSVYTVNDWLGWVQTRPALDGVTPNWFCCTVLRVMVSDAASQHLSATVSYQSKICHITGLLIKAGPCPAWQPIPFILSGTPCNKLGIEFPNPIWMCRFYQTLTCVDAATVTRSTVPCPPALAPPPYVPWRQATFAKWVHLHYNTHPAVDITTSTYGLVMCPKFHLSNPSCTP